MMTLIKKFAITAVASLAVAAGFPAPASASICASATSCSLTLTQTNSGLGGVTGNFGTVTLNLTGTTVSIAITMATGWDMKLTGFSGIVGFADSLGGGLSMTNLVTGPFVGAYSGSLSHATNDLHWDGFGFANNAVATTKVGSGGAKLEHTLSFDVTKAGLTDVNFLLNLFNPAGGDGAAYFVVDGVAPWLDNEGARMTGLVAVTGGGCENGEVGACGELVPEPGSLSLMLIGLLGLTALGFAVRPKANT